MPVEKFSIINVAEILAMGTKLHSVQLCKILVKSDNLDFSLFHGVPPFEFFALTFMNDPPKIQRGDPMKK